MRSPVGAWWRSNGEFQFRTCFVAGTKVKTPSGYRNIEDIRAGDKVLSYNETTKRIEVQTVKQTFIRKTDRIYTLVYDTGTKLQTTATHPFYIEGKGWVKAADLHVGDDSLLAGEVSQLDVYGGARLQNVSYRQSKQGVIVGITVEDRAETVYNFEVNETHTYLVGESDVVVHNAQGYSPEEVKELIEKATGPYYQHGGELQEKIRDAIQREIDEANIDDPALKRSFETQYVPHTATQSCFMNSLYLFVSELNPGSVPSYEKFIIDGASDGMIIKDRNDGGFARVEKPYELMTKYLSPDQKLKVVDGADGAGLQSFMKSSANIALMRNDVHTWLVVKQKEADGKTSVRYVDTYYKDRNGKTDYKYKPHTVIYAESAK
ncbi:Hedgehog/intein hint domain protein [Leptonema illini DSM 21528]|uniref:Hedgehog/intein hint domain protein n=2 Tax=Leptonema illini TaxID=183 RepID=H2CLL6_9LEPT|nr:polymorphic toxin-type HINT domain-containing protein [Leptonema illini]EHQ04627.1 Hedgehog/intein hint domain protein [Leptonema illini DSM 21528]